MSKISFCLTLALTATAHAALAQVAKPFDAAAAFGARPSVLDLSISPDGSRVAYITPLSGQGSGIFTVGLAKGSLPAPVAKVDGNPDRLKGCSWVANDRLACTIYGVGKLGSVYHEIVPYSRVIAIDADGSNFQMLSHRDNIHSHGIQLGGGEILDLLPDENGAVLMSRVYVPDARSGTRTGSEARGLGVDWVDTRTLTTKQVEPPRYDATDYLSDGHGTIRIMGLLSPKNSGGYSLGTFIYMYRVPGSRDWHRLSTWDIEDESGFRPVAVDHDLNIAYGYKKKDGRLALYSVALDGSLQENVVLARPDVDVGGLLQFGRNRRVVGATYVTDYGHVFFFDKEIERLRSSLAKALPEHTLLSVVDFNQDETKLLIRAGNDRDPGVYYIFDRKSHELQTFLVVRGELEGVRLAEVKPITYPAADGTMIPGYLTLPPGVESAKGLPAIVMPHGGPSARDFWRFDWFAQFFAARGFAVLQPNFRGSAGYGDAWLENNGFQSWHTSIGDIVDAGRWLVSEGIADPSKLGIVGWSYGGYAALQSAVVAPDVFKAVIAVAPVTDFASLKESRRYWGDFVIVSRYIGDGPHIREGSPAKNADRIKAPVLMFQGDADLNVPVAQSHEMDARLKAAGVPHELVTWVNLDHGLDDSAARTEMLRRSDEFLRKAMNLGATSVGSAAQSGSESKAADPR